MSEIQHVVSIGERSSDSEEAETQSISNSLMARFKTVNEAAEENEKNKSQSPTPKIQKVIFLLQDTKDFEKYYEPRVASLGPIHHGKEKYQRGEKYKLLLTSEFVKGSGKDIKSLYKKIEQKIKKLKGCFEEEVINKYDGDDEGLAWLLFVDGCAILQYMYCATNMGRFDDLSIENDSTAFADQDLFLLENQVPYCLLKWLMRWSKNKDLKNSIETFIKGHVYVPLLKYHSSIFCCACLSSLSWNCWQTRKQKQAESKQKARDPTHLLDLLRTILLGNHQRIIPKERNIQNFWQSYRNFHNVQELRAAGIYVERSKNERSCLSDISFTRLACCLGYLWLPPITVDDSTRPKFLNLIAYEMCLDFKNDFGVTSYISFLNSLISDANDVKELRKASILHNFLNSDEEVAKLFNEIGTDLVPNYQIYSDVKIQIQNHYKKLIRTWLAQQIFTYFRSPTIMAFTGAFIGLVLTATQTWYAVNSPCDDLYKSLVLNLTGKR